MPVAEPPPSNGRLLGSVEGTPEEVAEAAVLRITAARPPATDRMEEEDNLIIKKLLGRLRNYR